jgi:uncharacterized protein
VVSAEPSSEATGSPSAAAAGRRRGASARLPRTGRGRAAAWILRPRRRRAATTAPDPSRRRRVATLAGSGTAALLAAAAGGATWYYAGRITEPPGRRPVPPLPDDGVQVREISPREVVLGGPAADRPGWWGLRTAHGWLRVGPPLGEVALDPTDPGLADVSLGERRAVEHRVGAVDPGDTGRLEAEAIPPDLHDLDPTVEEVTIAGPLGDLPGWWFPAAGTTGTTVAVLVHGRSGSRREVARWAPSFVAAGVPCLAISYRNAPDAPPSPDGRSHLGATEWEDVAAAVEHVLDARGAEDVVLFGASMGGACIAELLARSGLAAAVRAIVLDAPVRHWGPVLRAAARQRGLPPAVLPLLLPPTMALAGARGRIDWRGLDHLDDPRRFRLPTLLFHGDLDPVVPVALSDAFAATRPDVVTYHRVPRAGHVATWNLDRTGCEAAVGRFLRGVLATDRPPPLRLVPGGRP